MKKKLLISFSGGRTSAFMTQWLLNNKSNEFDIIIVFANTGRENEETLRFIKRCEEHFKFKCIWIECVINSVYRKGIRAKEVDFDTASRNGEPFEEMIKKYSIPNRTSPFCSEYMKKMTINSYAKQIGFEPHYTAIGIRYDEIDRISKHYKKDKLIYPLISFVPMVKSDINKYWLGMPFDLQLKGYEGNCLTCWKKSLRKLLTIAKENPSAFDWDIEMEQKYENYIPNSRKDNINIKPPLRFHRNNLSATDILRLSKEPFEVAGDDSKIIDSHKQMELFGFELDVSNGCSESCEAF